MQLYLEEAAAVLMRQCNMRADADHGYGSEAYSFYGVRVGGGCAVPAAGATTTSSCARTSRASGSG